MTVDAVEPYLELVRIQTNRTVFNLLLSKFNILKKGIFIRTHTHTHIQGGAKERTETDGVHSSCSHTKTLQICIGIKKIKFTTVTCETTLVRF